MSVGLTGKKTSLEGEVQVKKLEGVERSVEKIAEHLEEMKAKGL